MKLVRKLRGVLGAGLLGAAALLATGGQAEAGGHYRPHGYYKWVVCYEAVQVPYTKCITLYDHCGRPYEVTKTFWRTVQVPVRKKVWVH